MRTKSKCGIQAFPTEASAGKDLRTNKYWYYRSEADIIPVNLSDDAFVIRYGERLCRIVVSKHEKSLCTNIENLIKSEGDSRGFGHTGKI